MNNKDYVEKTGRKTAMLEIKLTDHEAGKVTTDTIYIDKNSIEGRAGGVDLMKLEWHERFDRVLDAVLKIEGQNPIDALEPFIREAAKAEGKEVDEESLKAARAYCEEPVIVIGRCKDCAFWRRFKKRPAGQCSCEKLNYSKPEVGCEPDGVWFWADYADRAGLETGEDFGCIHWRSQIIPPCQKYRAECRGCGNEFEGEGIIQSPPLCEECKKRAGEGGIF